jgi:phosphate-selective porin OprO/OprP
MKFRFESVRIFITGALLGTGVLTAQPRADDIGELRDQIRLLDQKLRVLERRQEIKDEAVAAGPKAPVAVAGAGGFGISSADKSFELKLKALIQFDGRFFLDDGAPNRDAFLLRRVRTVFSGTAGGIYDFNITPEFGGGTNSSTTVGLWDAFVAARFTPRLGLRFGKFPSAVGLEPGSNRHFIESPLVNALLPNRDIGVEAFGSFGGGFFDYRLGVFNGAANNTANFGGASADYSDGDKTVAGRVTVAPFKQADGALSKLSLGLGASRGNEIGAAGTNLSNGLSNISSGPQQAIFSYGSALYANGAHTRISPSIEWYTGMPFSLAAEYAVEKQDIAVNAAGSTHAFENSAWRASAAWVLTGEASDKAGVTPMSPFAVSSGGWGAFEVVAGISGLALDPALFRAVADGGGGIIRNNNVTGVVAYAVGLNWYLNRHFRFLINVEQARFDGAKTPTAAVGARDDSLAILTRAHLSF